MILKILKTVFWTATLSLLLWVSGFVAFTAYVVNLKPVKTPEMADAIIVLTGGPGRVNTGFDLLESGAAGNLFISGVDSRVSVYDLLALWKNEPVDPVPCCIVLGQEAQNTHVNAMEAQQWILDHHIKSIILVTANYHIPRSLIEFQRRLPDISIVSYPVGSFEEAGDTKKEIFRIFKEYHKTVMAFFHLSRPS